MRSLLCLSFASFCLMLGQMIDSEAQATVNAYQDRQAEAICQVNPTQCR